MIKKIYMIAALSIMILFIVSFVSASKYYNTCETYNSIKPGNQINLQNQHFVCCKDSVCKFGNGLRKHINLVDEQKYGAYGEAEVNVYNYQGLDRLNIVLRTSGLPKNQVFKVWILQRDSSRSFLGAFKTNSIGRGHLVYSQTLSGDFNKYHTIVVEWGDPIRYLSGNLNFNSTKVPFSQH